MKRYAATAPAKSLILIEKGLTNSKKGEIPPDKWIKEAYPSVYNHLSKYEEKAVARTDKGDYFWELRACDYYDEFKKPKIMYQVFQVKPCFVYDDTGMYCNNSMWIIPSEDKVLLAILNSKVGWWLISKYCTAIQNGYQLIWKYFGQIPIARPTSAQAKPIEDRVNQILNIKKQDPEADISNLESEIDHLVYELYDLTADEIKIIEG